MLSRKTAAIIIGLLLLMLTVGAWSLWYNGPLVPQQARKLGVSRLASASNQLVPIGEWRAGTGEGEHVLQRFLEVYNEGLYQEQNLVGKPDFVLRLQYGEGSWVIQVFGEWFRVFRPGRAGYTIQVSGWSGFRREFLDQKIMGAAGIPFILSQVIDDYMHERISGNTTALADFLLSHSYYQVIQLTEEPIRGYEVKEARRRAKGDEYSVMLRVFGTKSTAAWEEEYLGQPMANTYRLALIERKEYVSVHP